MSKNRSQIQFKVLAILKGGDVGANPSAEEAENIDGYIDAMVDELAGDKVWIGDADELEDKLFMTFCKLVADAAAEEYGGKSDPKMAQYWRNRIMTLTAPVPGYGPQTVEYF